MRRGIQGDLRERLVAAHRGRTCVFATSPSDARRLREACRRGDVVSPAPRVYALPELWDQLSQRNRELYRLRALGQLHPSWVFSAFSAAAVYGLEVSNLLYGKVHLASDRQSHTRSNARVERHVLSNDKTEVVDGIRVTSLVRTVYDCVLRCSFPAGLAIADSALRVRGIQREELLEALSRVSGRRKDSWRVAETVALADGRSANGGESVARAMMIKHGFMPPDLQHEVQDPVDDDYKYYVDFYWELPEGNVAGELDGHEKYQNPAMTKGRDPIEVLADERLRESRLTGAKLKVMRFSYADIFNSGKFCHLLTSFGVPRGFPVPRVAFL